MKKVGRNDPCPCGSGKKYKKCCDKKSQGIKFKAEKIHSSSIGDQIQKSPLTSFF